MGVDRNILPANTGNVGVFIFRELIESVLEGRTNASHDNEQGVDDGDQEKPTDHPG